MTTLLRLGICVLFVAIAGSALTASTICNQDVCVQTWQQDTSVPGATSGYSYQTEEKVRIWIRDGRY